MGSLNSTGHLLIVLAQDDLDALWDFMNEMCEKTSPGGRGGFGVHSLPSVGDPNAPRYCVHPSLDDADIEFQDKNLMGALTAAAVWKAQTMQHLAPWRRD